MIPGTSKGLLDLVIAAGCAWAALYHTPVGAAVRSGVAWSVGAPGERAPLLAYYQRGVGGAPPGRHRTAPSIVAPRDLTAEEALGYGVHAVLRDVTGEPRTIAREVSASFGLPFRQLEETGTGPTEASRLIRRLRAKLRSDDGALLALFAGIEQARFAEERVLAEGKSPSLEALARQLPPGLDESIAAASQAAALGKAYGLSWPLPGGALVTSAFGVREHPIYGGERMHTGVDIGVPTGTAVRVTGSGKVGRASEDRINGRMVLVDHGYGVTTAYLHNSKLLVTEGEWVAAGQVIAMSGNSGQSTGPHLHYQLELGGRPVDPLSFRRHLQPSVAFPASP